MKKFILVFIILLFYSSLVYSQWLSTCTTSTSWSQDAASRLKVKGDYIYVTGTSYFPGDVFTPASWSIRTVKYSTSCGTVWTATYSSASSSFLANGIDIDGNGNVYVVGTEYQSGDMDMITIKYNSSGAQQWAVGYDGGGNDRGNDIGVRSTGDVYICGASYYNGTRLEDICVVHYNSSGTQQHVAYFDNDDDYDNLGYDEAYALTIDEGSWSWGQGLYVAGAYNSGNHCGTPCYLDAQIVHYKFDLTYDNDDHTAHYGCGPTGDDFFTDIEVSSLTGRVYGVGAKYCEVKEEPKWAPGHQMFIFMTYWVQDEEEGGWHLIDYNTTTHDFCDNSRYYYEDGGSNIGTSLQVVPSGGDDYVYATGTSTSGLSPDIVTYKVDEEGNKIWIQRYNSGGTDFSPSIAVNSSYAFVTGARTSSNLFLLRYPLGGGSPCIATYSASELVGGGSTIGVIGTNIYITGSLSANDDYLMLKYSQSFNCDEEEDHVNISGSKVSYELKQNYPNPFNPSTTISYIIPSPSIVSLKIYNTLGQTILDIPDKYTESGEYSEFIDASAWTSGIYFYKLEAVDVSNYKSFKSVQKMLLIK
jgi:hypothetical protein